MDVILSVMSTDSTKELKIVRELYLHWAPQLFANKHKAMVFPVVMYRCESWNIKKAECRRIDAFKLWCWRRLLRVPWTARTSKQSMLKEINPEYSLEGRMLKLNLILWPPDAKS